MVLKFPTQQKGTALLKLHLKNLKALGAKPGLELMKEIALQIGISTDIIETIKK